MTLLVGSIAGRDGALADAPLKIGFIVKMPEQVWFINEQTAAATSGAATASPW